MNKSDEKRIRKEVDQNYDFFKTQLPELIKEHQGDFALLRHQRIIRFFPDAMDAYFFGQEEYSDDLFSVQEITDEPVRLGIMEYVLS